MFSIITTKIDMVGKTRLGLGHKSSVVNSLAKLIRKISAVFQETD